MVMGFLSQHTYGKECDRQGMVTCEAVATRVIQHACAANTPSLF